MRFFALENFLVGLKTNKTMIEGEHLSSYSVSVAIRAERALSVARAD